MVFLTRLLRVDVCKQSLVTLRKSTGHSFQHCKQVDTKKRLTYILLGVKNRIIIRRIITANKAFRGTCCEFMRSCKINALGKNNFVNETG